MEHLIHVVVHYFPDRDPQNWRHYLLLPVRDVHCNTNRLTNIDDVSMSNIVNKYCSGNYVQKHKENMQLHNDYICSLKTCRIESKTPERLGILLKCDDFNINYSDGDCKSIAKVHFVNRHRGLINGISCDQNDMIFRINGLISPWR